MGDAEHALAAALAQIGELDLIQVAAVAEIRQDYTFLRKLENRLQALHDQQTHVLPSGEDLAVR